MNGIKLRGTGRSLPQRVVTNEDLSRLVDTNDQWIVSRTGIETRYCCQEESHTQLCVQAARAALERAGISPAEIGACIVATVTPDHAVPSAACLLQRELGLPEDIPCFDLNAACTGFVYALHTMECLLNASPRPFGLVVGAEALSRVVDWTDRSTCILFGDGAAAAVLTNGDAGTPKRCLPSAPRLRDVRCGADGRQYSLLTVGGGTNRNYKPGDPVQDDFYLQMQGREVFKQAVRSLSAVCSELLEDNGLTLEDIDLFIPHQANLRIIEAVGDRLKLGSEKIFVNLDEYGNTSAASIPLGIGDACAQGRIRPGSRVLLSAFGGGFTWGAALLEF